jgi:hypothetical protein
MADLVASDHKLILPNEMRVKLEILSKERAANSSLGLIVKMT